MVLTQFAWTIPVWAPEGMRNNIQWCLDCLFPKMIQCLPLSLTLTHCGLVMPYGDLELGQHWLRYWPVTWQHQAITWTNVHHSSLRYYGIHWREISLEMSFVNMSLKVIDSRQQSHLPGANELTLTVTLSTPYFHHSPVLLPEETVFMSPLSITDYLPCLSVSIHRVLGVTFH